MVDSNDLVRGISGLSVIQQIDDIKSELQDAHEMFKEAHLVLSNICFINPDNSELSAEVTEKLLNEMNNSPESFSNTCNNLETVMHKFIYTDIDYLNRSLDNIISFNRSKKNLTNAK